MNVFILLLSLLISCQHKKSNDRVEVEDKYLWLEEIQGTKAINWAREQNKKTFDVLKKDSRYDLLFAHFKDQLTKKDRLPYSSIQNGYLLNFWTDEEHLKGILRKTTLKEFKKDKPSWETILDLDQLSKMENKSWVYKGLTLFPPQDQSGLLHLSNGGKDAVYLREFDLSYKSFVQDGFNTTEETKVRTNYLDKDHLLFGAANDPEGATTSGYPYILRKWKRGTDVFKSPIYFQGEKSDVSVWGGREFERQDELVALGRGLTFHRNQYWIERFGKREQLPLPEDIIYLSPWGNSLLFKTRTDWTYEGKTYQQNLLLLINLDQFKQGKFNQITILYTPAKGETLAGVDRLKNDLILNIQKNVTSELWHYWYDQNKLHKKKISLPQFGTASVQSSSKYQDKAFLTYHNFLMPSSLYLYHQKTKKIELIKQAPKRFNSSPFVTEQLWATSSDGTKVPYFVVRPKKIILNGQNPTLLYGYGGFNTSLLPNYLGNTGGIWLERGGIYVQANIRGGGEFGPSWHLSALKDKRQKAFDDFIAIAEDLIKRKITSPHKLAISGGSNGGLLVGAVTMQRPELFQAVICSVPLLDMLRFHKLLAGSSWMAEYGNPDLPEEKQFIEKYSPYQNIKNDRHYPKIFFKTSTMDDRVHPGHARKMVAKMQDEGHTVLYYENIEGGHGGAADWQQRAEISALEYTYLYQQLFD